MQKGKRISFLAMVWLHDEHHDAQLSFFNEPIIVNSVLTDWIGNFLGNYDSAFDYRIARHLYACVRQRKYGYGSAIFLDGTFVPSLWVAKLLEVENGEQRKLLLAFSIGDLKANK
jgi:hypothetical protein